MPARKIRAGQRVALQIHPDPSGAGDGDRIAIHALGVDGGGWLATHTRAISRGSWVIDPAHWDGLPDGHTRATVLDPASPPPRSPHDTPAGHGVEPLAVLLGRRHADIAVATRPLTDYAHAATHNGDSR